MTISTSFLLLAAAALATDVPGRVAAAEVAAVADLLEVAHPALHRYEPAAAWETRRAREVSALRARPMVDELTLGAALHRLLAPVGDAHLGVALPMYGAPDVAIAVLPLLPVSVAEGVFLDASPEAVPEGARLLAVDGVEVEALYADLVALALVDGGDPHAARTAVERDLPRFHALAYGMAPTHTVRVALPDGTETEVTLTSAGRAEMGALRASRRVPAWSGATTTDGRPRLDRVDGLAVLRAPTFGLADTSAFRADVALALGALDPDEPLLIDVRGNPGGTRVNAQALLDRLVPGDPSAQWTDMRVRIRKSPRARAGALRWLYGSPDEQLRRAPFEPYDDLWRWEGDPMLDRPPPEGPRHAGPVAVLVDGVTGSAANTFVLSLAVARPDVVVVGAPLGGACDRHVGEIPALWTGRRSGVTVLFSIVDIGHVYPPRCVPGRGLTPDASVSPTAADLAARVDPWVAAAREALGLAGAPPELRDR